jgi:hypothetical protein
MESGEIKDSQISASSQWDNNHAPQNGRLNFRRHGKADAWVSKANDHATSWLQVDFQNPAVITKVLTQGRGDNNLHSQWVTAFTLSYSNDGDEFQQYNENGKPKVKQHKAACFYTI